MRHGEDVVDGGERGFPFDGLNDGFEKVEHREHLDEALQGEVGLLLEPVVGGEGDSGAGGKAGLGPSGRKGGARERRRPSGGGPPERS